MYNADQLCNLGIEAEKRRDIQQAVVFYADALRIYPNHMQSLNNMASVQLQGIRDVIVAEQYARKLHELYPMESRLLGLCLLEQCRMTEALPLLPDKEKRLFSLMVKGDLIDQSNCPCGCGDSTRWTQPEIKPERVSGRYFGLLNRPYKCTEMANVLKEIAKATKAGFIAFALGGEKNISVRKMYEQSIPASRLQLIEYANRKNFLNVAADTKVMLDGFPYNGIMTMRDCLYVGTPVVCLIGHQRTAVKQTIPNKNLVDNEDGYINRAVALMDDIIL